MPIAARTQNLRLAAAWGSFRRTKTTSLRLREHAEFPEYFCRAADGEDYLTSLLRRVFGNSDTTLDGDNTDLDDSDVMLLRKEESHASRTALFRVKACVVQVSDINQTRQITSCLGRIGIIDILIEQLSEKLQIEGSKPITMSELAAFTWGATHLESKSKLLSRLNKGHLVTEINIMTFAKAFDLNHTDLYFDHPEVYCKSRKINRANLIKERNRAGLLNYRVEFEHLDPNNPELIQRVRIHGRAGGEIEYEEFKPDSAHTDQGRDQYAAVFLFCDAFNALLRPGGNFDADLARAFVGLKEAGLKGWVGDYDDRVPIDGNAEENVRSHFLVSARRVRRMIIAFTEIGAGPPSIKRDLSHIVELFPTIEDVLPY